MCPMTAPLLETTSWIAHVAVSSGLAHLDRPFDYLIPDDLVDRVQVGVRVRVKLAGRLCDGVVVAVDHEQQPGVTLAPVE
ncbi:primosomal protein N', partial [Cutibacterium acnes subsp. acnes]|nr:primosomal protein N' [Cutibacterium acnes subsp. acnes]